MLQANLKGTRKLTLLSVLVALSLASYVVESLFPPLLAFAPGAKLGLSNIFIVLCLVFLGGKLALLAVIAKCLIAMALFGNPISAAYSLFGGVLSLLSMQIAYKTLYPKLSLVGVSVVGGLLHNAGQIIVASLLLKSTSVFFYLPYLLLAGVAAGIVVGFASHFAAAFLQKHYCNAVAAKDE